MGLLHRCVSAGIRIAPRLGSWWSRSWRWVSPLPGARPGPACYDLGGTEPTVTDANVVLGYLAPEAFLGGRRREVPAVSVVSLGEIAAGMADNNTALRFVERFRVVSLKPQIALAAAEIDRELIGIGQRLGENDNWIAGFARYYGVPLISNDVAFDRVPGLRRVAY